MRFLAATALTMAFAGPAVLAQSYTCSSPNILQTLTNSSTAGTASGSVQSIVVPSSPVTIDALGAQGGAGGSGGGLGAEVAAAVSITPGQTLCVVVGGRGGSASNGAGAGGGGSFVYAIGSGTCASNLAAVTAANLLVAAGGGGGSGLVSAGRNGNAPGGSGIAGASAGSAGSAGGGSGGTGGSGGGAMTNSGGGGGLLTDGASANTVAGGQALIHGAAGGVFGTFANGGFGGGGAAAAPGGGGGGYNGGGAGGISDSIAGGGGGGSFSATAPLSPYTQSGIRTGNGIVTLCYAPPAATHFSVSAPASATAGSAVSFTVTALDASNNTATGYNGTVHFTSSDGSATLPSDTTLTNGTRTFPVTLRTTGSQMITATDTVTSSITGTSSAITVNVGPATHFTVSAPAAATAGTSFNFTITALDASNNTATGYNGTVHFTSSDGSATLPSDAILTNGTRALAATLRTAGSQTISATDTASSSITGSSSAITVHVATGTIHLLSAPACPANSNWSNPACWDLNRAPVAGDDVVISGNAQASTTDDLGAGCSAPFAYDQPGVR
jgi:hypothetical protein